MVVMPISEEGKKFPMRFAAQPQITNSCAVAHKMSEFDMFSKVCIRLVSFAQMGLRKFARTGFSAKSKVNF